ncbi:hypothetical protein HN695_08020 [Candidatus Woesearchaeota archaeon]|jgi:hypothetical protein|nr:hypothetical protein [Candidatus Woesearchaeota archaeon]MBT5272488.1 hypothetical protein [Candidatus Woesearchaeota archaeon]MBT6041504.1 hypothetical protein [Candidatus Woesearchaeota archaeon]MBT6336350.1 hypothetical protein [Candidatus Woesearchaeota archaeon]MBT7928252.1 hypothetical protein [Candidatus Woesearchaeota archaeon]
MSMFNKVMEALYMNVPIIGNDVAKAVNEVHRNMIVESPQVVSARIQEKEWAKPSFVVGMAVYEMGEREEKPVIRLVKMSESPFVLDSGDLDGHRMNVTGCSPYMILREGGRVLKTGRSFYLEQLVGPEEEDKNYFDVETASPIDLKLNRFQRSVLNWTIGYDHSHTIESNVVDAYNKLGIQDIRFEFMKPSVVREMIEEYGGPIAQMCILESMPEATTENSTLLYAGAGTSMGLEGKYIRSISHAHADAAHEVSRRLRG